MHIILIHLILYCERSLDCLLCAYFKEIKLWRGITHSKCMLGILKTLLIVYILINFNNVGIIKCDLKAFLYCCFLNVSCHVAISRLNIHSNVSSVDFLTIINLVFSNHS